jgi:hypothetical protein
MTNAERSWFLETVEWVERVKEVKWRRGGGANNHAHGPVFIFRSDTASDNPVTDFKISLIARLCTSSTRVRVGYLQTDSMVGMKSTVHLSS